VESNGCRISSLGNISGSPEPKYSNGFNGKGEFACAATINHLPSGPTQSLLSESFKENE
jgi:hypothetical protein